MSTKARPPRHLEVASVYDRDTQDREKTETMHVHYTSGPKAILETQTSMIEGGEDGGQKGH